ncbi:DNA polymerase III subunit gamma/tau [Pseudanabaena mucicola]|uniref:DNA polymerase III subunit gamma/tau n=1 Tax=Pseudanabaena mucicola FACHB-723 TaxID=2692860 RepID=A0ABR8A1A0_9CYAN|nr:DNA polymerase III subunit gamma/tau [Pseudanabaena mucicola]MBD2189609.1 DNA polymerase III subunit gamma/tau [Pseudanabaena mucicola FACHB-723]
MGYEPLHHKYRPQTFADLVGQEAIAHTLSNALNTKRIAPAYLFTGARGTGKTSSARIMAKSLNCLSFDNPTPTPCGKCELCHSIANGNALDITEIDAASNTGVDNIRELIERAQFAPVKARFKIYIIDECLTGDTLVQTDTGLMRIDDQDLLGKQVLSYNEKLSKWEYKKVLRWLDRGVKPTLIIKTNQRSIQCTGNHLIRTESGWTPASNIKIGMNILSPVVADAEKSLKSLNSYFKKVEDYKASCPTGSDILTKKIMVFGKDAQKTILQPQEIFHPNYLDLSTAHYWEMLPLPTPTNTADFQELLGHMDINKKNGWNTKLTDYRNYAPISVLPRMMAMENSLSVAVPCVIPNSIQYLTWLSLQESPKTFLWNGLIKLLLKAWHGGIWMMERLCSPQKVVPPFTYLRKDILGKTINLLNLGYSQWDIQPNYNPTKEEIKPTTTFVWEQMLVESGYQNCSNTLFPQWHTSLERVESVTVVGDEPVYDIEVEDNHNFVANGLLVHNCHMLSTAAFNALLKTLEEPPDRVTFILATTDPQRVLPTIISRCQRFDFRRIPLDAMVKHLGKIAANENINIHIEALTLVAQIAQGGLRDAESLLDQLSLLDGEITVEAVWDLVGSVPEQDLLSLVEAIANDHATQLIDYVRRIMDRGREPLIVLQNLANVYRDLLIAKTASDRSDLVAMTSSGWERLSQLAQTLTISSILLGQQHLRSAELQIRNSTQPRLWLEVTLMGLLPSAQGASAQSQSPQSLPTPVFIPNRPPIAATQTSTYQPSQQVKSEPVVQPIPQVPSPAQTEVSPTSQTPATPDHSVTISPVIETPIASSNDDLEHIPSVGYDLDQLWQQVLSMLTTPSRSVFIQIQAHILTLDSASVKVGLAGKRDETTKNIVVQKRSELEAAFAKTLQRPTKVMFTFVSSPSSTESVQVATPLPASPAIANPVITAPTPITKPVASPPVVPPTVAPIPAFPVSIAADADANVSTPQTPQQTGYVPMSDDDRVIRNLAELFNGQIVDLDEEPAR